MSKDKPYWFAAKTYGMGWSVPVTWQGWAVVLVFFALLLAGLATLDRSAFRLVYVVVLAIAFAGVVAWKGERPLKWRWGRRK